MCYTASNIESPMPKSKKPRKKYDPSKKRILANPVEFAVEGVKVSSERDEVREFRLKVHTAYLSLRDGTCTVKHMDNLITAHNLLEALHQMKFGFGQVVPYSDYVLKAHSALVHLRWRFKEKGRFVAKSDELSALSDMADVLDDLTDLMTVVQFEKACAFAKSHLVRLRSNQLRNPQPQE